MANYFGDMTEKFRGMMYGLKNNIETWRAAEIIDFGDPVFGYTGDNLNCYKAKQDISTIVWDADFVTDNTITVTINGDSISEDFDTDHATTIGNVKDAINSNWDGITAELTDSSGDNRTIKITWHGHNLDVSESVTGGASQAGSTITYDNDQVFLGVAIYSAATVTKDSEGVYDANSTVNVMTEGKVYIEVKETVNSNTSAYVVTTDNDYQGKFSATSSDYTTGCYYRSSASSNGDLALIEVRGMK